MQRNEAKEEISQFLGLPTQSSAFSFGKTLLAFALLHSVFLHILNIGFPLGSSIELLHIVDACKYLINE